MFKGLLFISIVAIMGCSGAQTTTTASNKINPEKTDMFLPSKYHLSKRSKSCSESKLFMENHVEFNESNSHWKKDTGELNKIFSLQCSIKGESKNKNISDLHLFYLDLDCLSSLSTIQLLKTLSGNKTGEEIFTLLLNSEHRNIPVEVSVIPLSGFSFVINADNSHSRLQWFQSGNSH